MVVKNLYSICNVVLSSTIAILQDTLNYDNHIA